MTPVRHHPPARSPSVHPGDNSSPEPKMTTTSEHTIITQRMIEHAEERLQAGDLIQASEKGWGAVAHYLKAVAKQRGWRNGPHRDFFTIKRRLAQETNDPDRIHLLFDSARVLHQNFYEPINPEEDVRQGIERVKEFIHRLERAGVLR